MMNFKYLNFCEVAVICGLVLSCRTVDKRDPRGDSQFTDTEVNQVSTEDSDLSPVVSTDVPTYLWSPAKRRAQASFLFLTAEYMSLNGDSVGSLPAIESAYNLDPNAYLAAKLIYMRGLQGDREQSLQEAKRMVLLYPKSAQLHFLYGQLLFVQKDFEEALNEFRKTISLDAVHEQAYLGMILVLQMLKKQNESIDAAKSYVKALPSSAQAWSTLARLYLTAERKKEALEPARKAFDLQSSNPENILIYAMALELNDQSQQALGLYEQIYRFLPTNEELVGRMVEIYRKMGGLNSALELLNEIASKSSEKRPGLDIQRAIIYWEQKKYQEASRILEALWVDYPDSERLLYLSGIGLERIENAKEALDRYTKIPENSNMRVYGDVRRILILTQSGQYEEARHIYEGTLSNPHLNEDVFVVYASSLSENGKNNEALNVTEEGITKLPNSTKILFLKAVYEEKLNKRSDSKKTIKEYLKKEPSDPSAMNFLGYMYAEDGENLDEAEGLLLKATAAKPNDGFYLDSLGWLYFQKKNYKKALELLNKAVLLEPEEGVIYEHIGRVYEAQGDKERARDYFEKALSKKLEEKDKARLLKTLESYKNKRSE